MVETTESSTITTVVSAFSNSLNISEDNEAAPPSDVIPATNKSHQSQMAAETMQLIRTGDSSIVLDPSHRNLILAMGNTGAGKTTLIKFFTEPSSLEAYYAGSRYLIKDSQQKISVDSTIVSQTIFPELAIDMSTSNAFYDLPGFSDTRSASIEIANAWFMKKVSDHAQRIKILFIVNYSSLRSGESRTDFKEMLEQATALIKNPKKYKTSMALLATKVESSRLSEKIIEGIVNFLQAVKTDLRYVIEDEGKLQAAQDIIDGITSQDTTGNYNRICYFKQPEQEGPLIDMPEVMQQKSRMENLLYNNINFTESTPSDFGFTLSPAANKVMLEVAEGTNNEITNLLIAISKEVQALQENLLKKSLLEEIGIHVKKQINFDKTIKRLALSTTRDEFIQELITFLGKNTIPSEDKIRKIENYFVELTFFEQMLNQAMKFPILAWTKPFEDDLQRIKSAMVQKLENLSTHIENSLTGISASVKLNYQEKIRQACSNVCSMESVNQILKTTAQKLDEIIQQAEKVGSVKDFICKIQVYLSEIGPDQGALVNLVEDIPIAEIKMPAVVETWLRPFRSFGLELAEEQAQLKMKIENEKHRIRMQEEDEKRRRADEERERQRIARENEEARVRQEAESLRQEHEAKIAQEQEAHRQALAAQQQIIANTQAAIAQASKKRRRRFLGIKF